MYNINIKFGSAQTSLIVKLLQYGKRYAKNSFYLRRKRFNFTWWIPNNLSIFKRFQKVAIFVAEERQLCLNLPTEANLHFAATLSIVKEWFYKIGHFSNGLYRCSAESIIKNSVFPHFSG